MEKTHSLFSIFILLSLSLAVCSFPTYSANEDGTVSVLVDPDDYEEALGPMQTKRFWSPHPSDYNPLRRPVPVPRNAKRDDLPYHPFPRIQAMRQQRAEGRFLNDGSTDSFDGILDGGRQKKQTRATTLIFRLGSWGLRRNKPNDKTNILITPSPNSST